jgi:hypothetical protein
VGGSLFVGRVLPTIWSVLFFKKSVLFLKKGRFGFEYAIICDDRRGEA